MPIPKPKYKETRLDFIKRAMSDKEMKKDFPTKTDKGKNQRYAVAASIWKEHKKKKSIKEHLFIEDFLKFKNNI